MSAVKQLGKVLALTVGGSPLYLTSVNYDDSYNVIDVTDTADTDNHEEAVGRATRTLQVDGILRDSGGTNKVLGKTITFVFNAITYNITDVSYDVAQDDIDVTDSATDANSTEFAAGLAKRKFTASMWMLDITPEPARNSPQTATLTFSTGVSVAGTLIIESMKVSGNVKDAQKVAITGSFQGTVTETALGLTAGGASKAVVLTVAPTLGVAPKTFTGNAVLMSKNIKGNIKSDVTVSYTLKFVGAVTEVQAS